MPLGVFVAVGFTAVSILLAMFPFLARSIRKLRHGKRELPRWIGDFTFSVGRASGPLAATLRPEIPVDDAYVRYVHEHRLEPHLDVHMPKQDYAILAVLTECVSALRERFDALETQFKEADRSRRAGMRWLIGIALSTSLGLFAVIVTLMLKLMGT